MTIAKARVVMKEELLELEKRSSRRSLILQAMAMGFSGWLRVRNYVEARSGPVTNTRLTQLLKNLKEEKR